MFKLDHPAAESVARIIVEATKAAWGLAIGGGDYPAKRERYQRMGNPREGDMVVEQSAGIRSKDCAMAVGWLERIEREPVDLEWEEKWNIEVDGPVPTERVFYITAIDGREARWVNAEFIQVPTYDASWWYHFEALDTSPHP